MNSRILSSSSNAINNAYKQVFGKCKTKYSGATILGFHDSYIIQQMLEDVGFRPFIVYLHNIKIFIASISNNCKEFASCFVYKYKQKQSVIWQKIEKNSFSISIFQDGEIIKQYQDITASSVWNQAKFLCNYDGTDLFGINHSIVQLKIKELLPNICTLDDWNNEEIMQHMFKIYLKKHVPGNEELLYRICYRKYNQKCTIIEMKSFICEFYNDNHELYMRELRA